MGMSYKEYYGGQLYNTYKGILKNYSIFQNENEEEIEYDFTCKEYKELINKYQIDKIAGSGSEFIRAKRLLHYLSIRLTHSSWYDNHIECNSLKLLEYSLNNPNQGINCLNKSKILQECCLALGIYARRVSINPFSPYDFDNHVVVEIYDRKMDKWIMMDPTTDGIFIDENKNPLSILEIRDKYAKNEFLTYVPSNSKLKDLITLEKKYQQMNIYICKNMFRFIIDKQNGFGNPKKYLFFTPHNYSIKENSITNMEYRINNIPEEYKEFIPGYKKRLEEIKKEEDKNNSNINLMRKSPLK